jgi:acetolactate synthase-1/2/3 large subunit
VLERLANAQRPAIWLGHGIRLSEAPATDQLETLLMQLNVPVILSWSGADLIDSDHPNVYGRCGVYGQRCANRIVENADVILCIGTRLSLLQIGYDITKIPAELIVVDIDEVECKKYATEAIVEDSGDFIRSIIGANLRITAPFRWLDQCDQWREAFPWVESPTHDDTEYINSYRFMEALNKHLRPDEIVVTDMGTALLCAHQVLKLKPPQRLITSQGLGEMGCGLPYAIGASFARNKGEVICLNCDGGMMFNLQELQTIVHHKLPIKLIIFCNDGYLMIKHTQKALGIDRVAVDKASGISCPQFGGIVPKFGNGLMATEVGIVARAAIKPPKAKVDPLAAAFGVAEYDDLIKWLLDQKGPAMIEVHMDPEQLFVPRLMAQKLPDGSLTSPKLSELSP